MKIVKLQDNLLLYVIPSAYDNKVGQNFIVLVNGSEALMIDAGYRTQCREVIRDLSSKGITVKKVIPSHFHPDHVEGITLLERPQIFGNIHAKETLNNFYSYNEMRSLLPSVVLVDDSELRYGDFDLYFKNSPGHSNCSMLIIINDKYVHIGDLYIRKDNGDDILPFVKWPYVQQHIDSLNMLLEYKEKLFLISHGLCPIRFDELKVGIKNRLKYLQALLDSDNTVSAEDAVKNCSKPFSFLHWREFVK